MPSVTLYGIPNCDTMKKARTWLAEHALDVVFHDYKKLGASPELIQGWLALGTTLDALLNRKGTTWRKLDDASRAQAAQPDGAVALLVAHPSLIKRPVLVCAGRVMVGFSDASYQAFFAESR